MPVLTVKGMPANVTEKLYTLLNELQKAVAGRLKLHPGEVSVFFPPDLLSVGLGEELICVVEGLFESPTRTTLIRDQLARRIMRQLRDFAVANLPQCGKVEVIVNRFNQEVDGFAVWEKQKEG